MVISTPRLALLPRLSASLAHHLFPPACVLCTAPGADLCAPCRDELTTPLEPACRQCGQGLASAAAMTCGTCLRTDPAYDQTVTAARYQPPFDQLVLALKYHARLALAPLFADLIAARLRALGVEPPDLLVPVPLARQRLAQRGFNQALEIARPLGRRIGKPVREMVCRLRHTPPQASLPLAARQANVRQAFQVTTSVAGQRVGLVDDVMTTGATLHELARALKAAGAHSVLCLVVARTPRD